MKIGSGFKSTPLINKDAKNASVNRTPRANLFSNESTENANPNVIDTQKSTSSSSNAKQNGSITRQDSLNDIDDDDDENPFFDFHTDAKDAEELYSEALLEELKQLQVGLSLSNKRLFSVREVKLKVQG